MLQVILILLIIALGVAVVWRIGLRPYRHRGVYPDRIELFLQTLLKRGFDGGVLVFEVMERSKTRRFIQFAKRITAPGVIGIEFGFPNAPWSRQYFEPMCNSLASAGFSVRVTQTGRDDTSAFLTVNLGSDLSAAVRLVDVALKQVLRVTESARIDALLTHVSPRDELVDR